MNLGKIAMKDYSHLSYLQTLRLNTQYVELLRVNVNLAEMIRKEYPLLVISQELGAQLLIVRNFLGQYEPGRIDNKGLPVPSTYHISSSGG